MLCCTEPAEWLLYWIQTCEASIKAVFIIHSPTSHSGLLFPWITTSASNCLRILNVRLPIYWLESESIMWFFKLLSWWSTLPAEVTVRLALSPALSFSPTSWQMKADSPLQFPGNNFQCFLKIHQAIMHIVMHGKKTHTYSHTHTHTHLHKHTHSCTHLYKGNGPVLMLVIWFRWG